MCCCDCPELEKTCWKWPVDKGAKVIAIIYLIEGLYLSLRNSLVAFTIHRELTYHNLTALESNFTAQQEAESNFTSTGKNFEDHVPLTPVYYYVVIVVLSIFVAMYLMQAISSALLLVGLTVKEKTAFIRTFLICNYLFIMEDVLELLVVLMIEHTEDHPAEAGNFWDQLTVLIALPFSIYSHILVSSHYKQVRRGITGPVQAATDPEEGFVNKYLRF